MRKLNLGPGKMPLCLALVFVCLAGLRANAALPAWTPYPPSTAASNHPGGGPWGGSVTRIVADDPASPSPSLWAATRGGVYYSSPGSNGGLWTARNSGLQSLDVRDIAVGPGGNGSRTMLAATYGKGVYLSRNSGQTWTRLSIEYHNASEQLITDDNAVRFLAVAVDPEDENRFFATAFESGYDDKPRTFYSINGGMHWEVLSDAAGFEITTQINRMVFSRDGTSTLFIGSGPTSGTTGRIYRMRPGDGYPTMLTPFSFGAAAQDLALPGGGTSIVLTAAGLKGVWAGAGDSGVGGSDSAGGDPSTHSATLFFDHTTEWQGPAPEITVKHGSNVRLNAVVQNNLDGQPITGAEYFVDTVGADGTSTKPITLYPDPENPSIAYITASFSTTGWGPGRHTLYVHGKINDGIGDVWGPFATVTLNLWREFNFPANGSNPYYYSVTAVSDDPAHPNRMLYYLYDGLGASKTSLYEIPDILASSPTKIAISPPEKEMRVQSMLTTASREFLGETMAGVFVRYNGSFSNKSKGMAAYDVAGFDYQPSGDGGSSGDAELAVSGGGTEVGNGSGGFNRWLPGQGWLRVAGGVGGFDAGRGTSYVRYDGTGAVWLSVDGFGLYRGETPYFSWTSRNNGVSQTSINYVTSVAPGAPDGYGSRALVMSTSQGVYESGLDQNGNDIWQEVLGDSASSWWRVASDPVDPVSAFYAVVESVPTGDGTRGTALHHSSDGGTAWERIFPDPSSEFPCEPGLYFHSFAAAPDDSGQLLAGDYVFGLWESLDGGVSWAPASSALEPVPPGGLPQGNAITVDIRRWPGGAVAKAVFLYKYNGTGVYLSGDDGRTWTLHTQGIDGILGAPYVKRLSFSPDGRAVVAALRNRGLWSVEVGAPPIFDPVEDQSVVAETELIFAVTANDDEPVNITADEDTMPPGATFVDTTFRWTPPVTCDGQNFDVDFHASDGFYDTPLTVRITVSTNQPPILDIQPTTTPFVTVGGTVALTVSATDPDNGETIPVSIESLPSNAQFNGTVFTWSPNAPDGPSTDIVFLADDGGPDGQTRVTVRITVNRNPVIDPIEAVAVVVGQEAVFQVTATDADNDAVTLGVEPETLPDGAFLDMENWFRWTPTGDQVGVHAVTFTAEDGMGGTHLLTVDITVNAPPDDPGGGGGGGCFLTILGVE